MTVEILSENHKKERKILRDAAEILNRVSGMRPTNPADTKRLFRAGNIGCEAAGRVMHAIYSLLDCSVDSDAATRINDAADYVAQAQALIDSP